MLKKLLITLLLTLTWTACLAAKLQYSYQIDGLKGPLLQNAKQRLDATIKNYKDKIDNDTLETIYHASSEQIKLALEPYGYFKPLINSELKHDGDQYIGVFQVMPGPQLHITRFKLDIVGPGKQDLEQALKNFPLSEGKSFSAIKYKDAKNKIFDKANERGYIQAKLTTDNLDINRRTYSCKIKLKVDTGDQFFIGPIHFNKSVYKESFLRKFVHIKPGEIYSPNKLIKLQESMSSTSFFSRVIIEPDMDHIKNHRIPINIKITPSPSQQYSFGLGYGTFTKVRTSAGVTFNHLTPTGHSAGFLFSDSQVQTAISTNYYIPGPNPITDKYTIGAQHLSQFPLYGVSKTDSVSGGFSHKGTHWRHSTKLILQEEKYKINDDDPYTRAHVLMPQFTLGYTSTKNIYNPPNGFKIDLTVRAATKHVYSDSTFVQGMLSGKDINTLTKNNMLILDSTFGYTAVHNLNKLPLSLRYYAGGEYSLRGYRYKSIGPGKYLKLGTVQWQHRLSGSIFSSLFYDAGVASNNTNASMKLGRGIGLVWQSPIGPVELDLAQAMSKRHKPFSFLFTIGPAL